MDVVFDTQPIWAAHGSSKPKMIWKFLMRIEGLDIDKLQKDFDTIDISDMLSLDRSDASTLNVRGTPSFFVNGKKLDKLGYTNLLDLVESEIYK